MKKYIGKRIISFLIVLVGVSILSFLLIAWSGKDPAEIIAHRGVSNPTPEQIEMIRVEMGLDQPLTVRYIQWLSGMFTGELGTSLTTHQPIVKDLHKYLATTTSLVGMAILWIIVLTVPISLLCARKRNRLFDQVNVLISVGDAAVLGHLAQRRTVKQDTKLAGISSVRAKSFSGKNDFCLSEVTVLFFCADVHIAPPVCKK